MDPPPSVPWAIPQTKLVDNEPTSWTDTDEGLQEALCIWREQAAKARWGPYHPVGGTVDFRDMHSRDMLIFLNSLDFTQGTPRA
jgi:hypothetical protein